MSDTSPPDAEDIPAQSQDKMPADEHEMTPAPDYAPRYPGVGKLKGKVAFITGGDSGIGRAVAVLYAREGADVAIAYLEEDEDAQKTKAAVEAEGRRCLLIPGDVGKREHAFAAIKQTVNELGGLNIVINNAAQQWIDEDLTELTEDKLRTTFDSNVMSYFFCTQAALPHLKEGDSIICTTSVNAFQGHGSLISYSTTRGASLAFVRSLALNLADKGIRVNAVAPGPIWTPFIPGTMPADQVEGFGSQVTMGRPGQPWEVATAFLFLASTDGNYYTGQCLHPNGGEVVNA